jgi:hypothetical protein
LSISTGASAAPAGAHRSVAQQRRQVVQRRLVPGSFDHAGGVRFAASAPSFICSTCSTRIDGQRIGLAAAGEQHHLRHRQRQRQVDGEARALAGSVLIVDAAAQRAALRNARRPCRRRGRPVRSAFGSREARFENQVGRWASLIPRHRRQQAVC